MKTHKKVLKIVLNVFIWIFVAFSICVTILALTAQSNVDGVPSVGGTCFLTVQSPSMEPTFKKGDLIFGQVLTTEEKMSLKEDDVITFKADLNGDGALELNSHRIVRINYDANGNVDSYVTKGDNKETNIEDTEPVKWQNVVAKWKGNRIPGVGGFLSFLQSRVGFLVVIVLPLLLFFLYEIFVFVKAVLRVKNEKATAPQQISSDREEEIKKKAIEEYLRKQAEEQVKSGENTSSDSNPESNKEE